MKTLKRKQYLLEEDEIQQNNMEPEEQPSVAQNILDKLNSGEITVDDIQNDYANGNISEEDYNEIMQILDNQTETTQPNPDDITYTDNIEPDQIPEPEFEAQPLKNKYNVIKLFDKFVELKEYINVYIKTYNDIETDHLTSMQINSLSKFYNEILTLKNNIMFYIDNNFATEDYKKNLYMYLLFNKDFATQIRKFRNVLHLNPNKLIDKKNEKK